jgi:monofunctional glycosyltransferase
MTVRKRQPRRRSRVRWWVTFIFKGAITLLLLSFLLVLPLRWVPPVNSSFMVQSVFDRGIGRPYYYTWQPYEKITETMRLAVIAAEDQRFPTHHGFDLEEIQNAVADRQRGAGVRGASTISQQVAKNLYLWSDPNWLRKGLEVWFTVLIEALWPKQRILEIYLNIAQFGDQIFGVETASRLFFGISASQLSDAEAALLAAVLPGPEIYFVDQPSAIVRQRQTWILRQMDQLGTGYLLKVEQPTQQP